MIKIGITGGSGCGKTTALRWLASKGAYIIDCDEEYHWLLNQNKEMVAEIQERFPMAFVDGKLDRKKLGSIVFNDETSLKDLNFITHKYVDARVNELIADNQAKYAIDIIAIDAIALIESGLSDTCYCVVGVIAPTSLRIERLKHRERITEEYAKARVTAQKPDAFYIAHCNYIIENSGDYEDFFNKCSNVLGQILIKLKKGA